MRRETIFLIVSPALATLSLAIARWDALSVSVFTIPSMITMVGLIIGGLAFGIILSLLNASPKTNIKDILFTVLFTALIFYVIDILVHGENTVRNINPFSKNWRIIFHFADFVLILGFCASIYVFLLKFRKAAINIFFLYSTMFFLSALLATLSRSTILPDPEPINTTQNLSTNKFDPPPIVLLILDELIGIEGLNSAPQPGGEKLASIINEGFLIRGFRVYGKAFSRYSLSTLSIGTTIDLAPNENRALSGFKDTLPELIGGAKLFEKMVDENRSVHVFNAFEDRRFDFCDFENVSGCNTFKLFKPISKLLSESELDGVGYYRALLDVPGTFNSALRNKIFGKQGLKNLHPRYLGFRDWMANLTQKLAMINESHFSFIHILLPHSPYVLDSACNIRGTRYLDNITESHNLERTDGLLGSEYLEKRRQIYSDYYSQAECTVRETFKFVDNLGNSPQFSNATIVVMGDHGSRISRGHRWKETNKIFKNYTKQDLIDNYSTMFAIRGPGITSKYDTRLTSIQRLVAEYLGNRENLGPDDKSIVILSAPDKIDVMPMPDFGNDAN